MPAPKKIDSKTTLPEGEVYNVHPETPRERMLGVILDLGIRSIGALLISLGVLGLLVYILTSDNPHIVDHNREEAFTALLTMGGAAIGFLFGNHTSRRH